MNRSIVTIVYNDFWHLFTHKFYGGHKLTPRLLLSRLISLDGRWPSIDQLTHFPKLYQVGYNYTCTLKNNWPTTNPPNVHVPTQ